MKNILITGAGDGVGKAVAEMLKDENLILVDRDKKNLDNVAKSLNARSFVCDITDTKQIEALKNYVVKTFKNLDVLINCAGVWTKGEISQLTDPHFKKINSLERIKDLIDTNTFGTIAMTTTFSGLMLKNKRGQIVNICSQSGVETEQFCPVYNASKHGIYYHRKAIQNDLAKHGIKITDVCPGLIKTNFYIRANDELPESIMHLGLEPQDVANCVKYVLDLPYEITIPSIEIRHIKNY